MTIPFGLSLNTEEVLGANPSLVTFFAVEFFALTRLLYIYFRIYVTLSPFPPFPCYENLE